MYNYLDIARSQQPQILCVLLQLTDGYNTTTTKVMCVVVTYYKWWKHKNR